jgi:hypothetical protein
MNIKKIKLALLILFSFSHGTNQCTMMMSSPPVNNKPEKKPVEKTNNKPAEQPPEVPKQPKNPSVPNQPKLNDPKPNPDNDPQPNPDKNNDKPKNNKILWISIGTLAFIGTFIYIKKEFCLKIYNKIIKISKK